MFRTALVALAAALVLTASGFSQTTSAGNATGGFGSFPSNTVPSGSATAPILNNGALGFNGSISSQLYNPYNDPRYSQMYGNRYYTNSYLNAGMSPAIVPALMGAVVGAVLGAHFGFKGVILGGIAGFLIGNAIWQHLTGQSVFDYLFYGPYYNPYSYGGYGAGYGGGYPNYGYGYPGMGYGYGYGTYPGYGYPGYMPPSATVPPAATQLGTVTVGSMLSKNPGSPTTDLEALRKSYFDAVNGYETALSTGHNVDATRTAMEQAQSAYQKAIEAASSATK